MISKILLEHLDLNCLCDCLSTEYFSDLEGRADQDPSLLWDFYSSSVFGKKLKLNTLSFKSLGLGSKKKELVLLFSNLDC